MTSIQSGHRYIIRNKKSNNSVVDLDSGTKRKIHCWAYHGGTNQQVESLSVSVFCCRCLTEKSLSGTSLSRVITLGTSRMLPLVNILPSMATLRMGSQSSVEI